MSVIIDGDTSIGIACHKGDLHLKLNFTFFCSLPVDFNHGQPWSLTMVNHDPGPWLAMVLIRPWLIMGSHLTKHGRPWSTMVDHDHGQPWLTMVV